MAIATIETPTGQVIKVEVPEGATEQQIIDFVSSQDLASFKQVEPEARVGQFITENKGIGDYALDAAGEFAAGINRGMIGVVDLPANIANFASEALGSDLRVAKVGDIPAVEKASTGGFVDNPMLRDAIGMTGEFIAPVPPVASLAKNTNKYLSQADDLAKMSGFTRQSAAKSKIAEIIKKDPLNADYAKYSIDNFGRLASDKNAAEAIKQGFDKGVLAAIKNSSYLDKRRFAGMVALLEKGKKNARFGAEFRPSDIAGKSLLKRVQKLHSIKGQAGKGIDAAANSLKGKAVDLSEPIAKMADSLEGFGIALKRNSKGDMIADFAETTLAPTDRGPLKEVIRQMSRLSKKGNPDAFDAHTLKRIIDRNVTYGKVKTGLSGEAERALKGFRSSLDNVLDTNFPAYKKHNDVYSSTVNALDNMQGAAGTKVDFFSDSADKAMGTSLRRLLSNTQSRANMIDSIKEIDNVLIKNGAKFEDDILSQVLFADELDSVFGAVARTSLKGQAQQAVRKGADAAANQSNAAVDLAGAGIEKLRGINEENAIKAIKAVIKP